MRKFTIAGALVGGVVALGLAFAGTPAQAQDVETGKKMYAGMYVMNYCDGKMSREQYAEVARKIIAETGYIPTSSELRAIRRSVERKAGIGGCATSEFMDMKAMVAG